MMVEDIGNVLIEHQFLKGLPADIVAEMENCATTVQYETGTILFREGEDAKKFYLIRQGKIAIEIFSAQKGPIIIQTLGEGEALGWSWLLPPASWRFSAKAVELTRAIELDGRCLLGKIEANHELGYHLLKRFMDVVVGRLEATRIQLLDIYGHSD